MPRGEAGREVSTEDDTASRAHHFIPGREEHVTCALTGMHLSMTTWCGRETTAREWTFTGADHALLSVTSRLTLCPECGEAIAKRAQDRVDGVMP